ncbi:MAG TPA: GTP cyclohydrolase I FolE [Actinomycetota bacterium]
MIDPRETSGPVRRAHEDADEGAGAAARDARLAVVRGGHPGAPGRNEAAERSVRDLLVALGQDPDRPGLVDTPRRVAASLGELLTPVPFTPTTFPNEEGYDELVLARDIEFHSLCEHHMLPFIGVAHVGYLPKDRIIGLSKLARVVDMFARRLQVQERMTSQIASWLNDNLEPKGVGVVLEAEHTCMALRGVRKHGSRTITSALLGCVRSDARTRQEFLSLATRQPERR